MTKLSVNINKIATLRNARGGNNPDLISVAKDCELFGAEGITVHPRPDERHITYRDVLGLKKAVTTEFNIEGNPDKRFIQLIKDVHPEQVTLVPDAPNAITSNSGWDTITNFEKLKDLCEELKPYCGRISVFVDPDPVLMENAKLAGADRVEFYTEPYAHKYPKDSDAAILSYIKSAKEAMKHGLGVNAGHDLDLNNLRFFKENIPNLLEVSIGHALICDALYFGLENTIMMYRRELR